jgi:UDP-N-acetylmuramyl pentapeptide phosphotransferase/UDP-N-acetylglucosamine-1-phosphate transferase
MVTEPDWTAWLIGFVGGAVVSSALWTALRPTFIQPRFLRRNFRGADVPVGVGVVIAVATVTVWALWRFVAAVVGWTDLSVAALGSVAVVAVGFGLLGFFDDVAASGDDKGFRGHLGALAHGRLTTGGLKLLGGGLLALAVTPAAMADWWRMVLGAGVIALGANLGNLFDRAPARCTKVALVCGVALFATCSAAQVYLLVGVAVVLGAAVGLVAFDARERLMLGDAGSNILGATLAWGLVATTDWQAQVVVAVILAALNLASEKVSFSKVIDDVAVLRAADRFGRADPET